MQDYIGTIDHATSVKKIQLIEEPTRYKAGMADFTYNPVFSVFDIGRINPPVPLDNSTVCLMAGFNFEMMEKAGLPTHYISLVNDDGEPVRARDVIRECAAGKADVPDTMRLEFVNRVMPDFEEGKGWDYSMFGEGRPDNYVQPIEFISRNGLPPESSVWKRVERGDITLQDLGLPAGFKKGDEVPAELKPLLDYSTKFEPDDRYLSPQEAQALIHITPERFAKINTMTRDASNMMTAYAASRGFNRPDGKVEYIAALWPGIGIVDKFGDAVCTWHEDRLIYGGVGVSKQRIRNKVKQLNPEWYADIGRAKKEAIEMGVKDFRTLMDPSIQYVSPSAEFFHAVNDLFRAGTNQWVGAKVYDVYPGKDDSIADTLDRAVEEFNKVK